MQSISTKVLGVALSIGVGVGLIAQPDKAIAAWQPQKPVEFVVMAGQGGGADKLARFIQSIIEKNKLASVPFIPINKGGGSGAEALRYLKDKAGDPHVIMATLNSYYTTPLRNPGIGVDIAKFTPIARLAEDTFVLWVHADTPIKTIDDYVKAVKAAGGKNWKMGGTGKAQEDELLTNMLKKAYNIDMTYIPYKGGGTVAKNLAGKHHDSTVNNPSETAPFYTAEKKSVRPIAAFTPKRLPMYPDTPTFGELGHPEMVYFMQRSVVAPPAIPKDAQEYYIALFKKVSESKEWQAYTKKQSLFADFLSGEELQKYFLKGREDHRAMLKKIGEIK